VPFDLRTFFATNLEVVSLGLELDPTLFDANGVLNTTAPESWPDIRGGCSWGV